eukprot:TRINITY_DN4054_c0_g1_i3.p1 TRINITY_DN4054_c0_g1~~TRINITY_DN4054_c0_g1_i3.p1  ORF type:complete len:298 (+),score=35.25 TRINITY_DN4054_c0_g1_i3:76-894(+)
MAVHGTDVATGGANHSVVVWDAATGRKRSELYGATGHREWVTCVAFSSEGRVVSGGMDSQLCLWSGRTAAHLTGHGASITALQTDEHNVAVSASHDGTFGIWSVAHRGVRLGTMTTKRATALVSMFWRNSLLAGGTRDGALKLFDVNSTTCVGSFEAHKGQVICIESYASGDNEELTDSLMTGGQDGMVRLWDLRGSQEVAHVPLHHGVVTALVNVPTQPHVVVTAGSDKLLHVLDLRKSIRPVVTLHGHSDGMCKNPPHSMCCSSVLLFDF